MSSSGELKERIIKQYGFALKDPNPNIRFLALEGLQELSNAQKFDGILPLINDNDRFVRLKAIQLCGVMRLSQSYPLLQKALLSSDTNTRMLALHALALSGNAEFLPMLVEAAEKEAAPQLRQTLVRLLYVFGDFAPWNFLAESAHDSDIGVRIDTAMVLGDLAPRKQAMDILSALLETESNNNVFATALLSLGKFRNQALIPYFQAALLHDEARIRANAIEALGQLPFQIVENLINPFLRDPSNRVKANVMCIFYENGFSHRVTMELQRFLNSPNRWERSSGAWLAGTYRIKEAVQSLIRLLSDEEGVVAGRSAWAIGQINAPSSFNELAAAYPRATQWALTHFIKAIGAVMKPSDASRIILMWSKERSPLLRAQFVDLLAQLRAVEFKRYAAPLLQDADHNVRAAAYRFFAAVDGVAANDLLFKGIADANDMVRWVCGELMLKNGDFRALKALAELLTDNEKRQRVQKAYSIREAAWSGRQQQK